MTYIQQLEAENKRLKAEIKQQSIWLAQANAILHIRVEDSYTGAQVEAIARSMGDYFEKSAELVSLLSTVDLAAASPDSQFMLAAIQGKDEQLSATLTAVIRLARLCPFEMDMRPISKIVSGRIEGIQKAIVDRDNGAYLRQRIEADGSDLDNIRDTLYTIRDLLIGGRPRYAYRSYIAEDWRKLKAERPDCNELQIVHLLIRRYEELTAIDRRDWHEEAIKELKKKKSKKQAYDYHQYLITKSR